MRVCEPIETYIAALLLVTASQTDFKTLLWTVARAAAIVLIFSMTLVASLLFLMAFSMPRSTVKEDMVDVCW